LFQLTAAGYCQIRLADGRRDEVGVNADPKASNLDVIPDDVLALWRGNGESSPSSQGAVAPGPVTPHKTPQALWWYCMLLVLASALAESALASRYLDTQREDERIWPRMNADERR
jgi:hypothetical protein